MEISVDCPHCGDSFDEDMVFVQPGDVCHCSCGAQIKVDYSVIVTHVKCALLKAGDLSLDLNSMEE